MSMLIADDQEVAIAGLQRLLLDGQQIHHVVTDPTKVVAAAVETGSRLVISGFFWSQRGQDGIDVVRNLRQALPDLPILVRAPHDDPHLRIGLKRLGASGLIATGAPLHHLGQAVVALWHRRPWFTPIPIGTPLLTTRDLTILQQLDAGRSQKELAARLDTSENAITQRLVKLRERFGARSTTALVGLMITRGLRHLPPETLEGVSDDGRMGQESVLGEPRRDEAGERASGRAGERASGRAGERASPRVILPAEARKSGAPRLNRGGGSGQTFRGATQNPGRPCPSATVRVRQFPLTLQGTLSITELRQCPLTR